MITAKTTLCIIIGNPVEHSLSPQMHNSAYKALGIDNEFVYVAANVKSADIQKAIEAARVLHIKGVTVTIPYKTNAMQYVDSIDETAQKIGAINTIVNNDGKLTGINTDWIGVLTPLEKLTNLENKKVAIIGAGGFAHAAVFATTSKKAFVTIYNRTEDKAKELAKKFQCECASLEKIADIQNADIIINATSVGMETETSIIHKELLHKHQIVFDAVYAPYETKLIQMAREKKATVIHGTELLLFQGAAQFELFTGKKAPIDIMRKIIMENIQL